MARWEVMWDFVQFSAVWHLPAHCKKMTVIPKYRENKKMPPRVFKVPFREVLLPQMMVHWGSTGLGQVPGSLTVCQHQEHPLLCESLGCSCFLGVGADRGKESAGAPDGWLKIRTFADLESPLFTFSQYGALFLWLFTEPLLCTGNDEDSW